MQNRLDLNKFVVFKVVDYLMAVPISSVLKTIRYPLLEDRSLREIGLVQVGHHTIRCLDLQQRLFPGSTDRRVMSKQCIVIARVLEGELCGIVVDEPPILMQLPEESIQPLPKSHPQSGLLTFASHVAVLPQEPRFTIFLLDLQQALISGVK